MLGTLAKFIVTITANIHLPSGTDGDPGILLAKMLRPTSLTSFKVSSFNSFIFVKLGFMLRLRCAAASIKIKARCRGAFCLYWAIALINELLPWEAHRRRAVHPVPNCYHRTVTTRTRARPRPVAIIFSYIDCKLIISIRRATM